MQPIDSFDLRLFDLNLLVAFDALMQERSVTKAAARMRVGQPAMSHALATLRVLLQDELLVRVGNVMKPTHRALLMHERVSQGLASLQDAVRLTESFDPMAQQRMFRLGFSSDVELILMPVLTALLREQAPGIGTVGHLVAPRDVERLLDDGRIDAAIGCFSPTGNRFRTSKLYEQALTCVWNPNLLDVELPLTRERYLELPHVTMTLDDNLRGCLDAVLSAAGETLNVVAGSDQFLSVLSTVASTPVVATLPSGVAGLHAERFGLRMTSPPIPLRLAPVTLAWSARTDSDLAADWLRSQISRILTQAMVTPKTPGKPVGQTDRRRKQAVYA